MTLIETLNSLDKDLFLFFNGLNNNSFDYIMVVISEKLTWLPLYLGLTFYIFKKFKFKKALFTFLALVFLIVLVDQTSVHLFKNVFLRLRPCFNNELTGLVHYVNLPGGKYGFVSSHAANSFGFAFLSSIILKKRTYTILIFIWAFMVSYSRIYLGVHYPGDIIGGALLGIFISMPVYIIFKELIDKRKKIKSSHENDILS